MESNEYLGYSDTIGTHTVSSAWRRSKKFADQNFECSTPTDSKFVQIIDPYSSSLNLHPIKYLGGRIDEQLIPLRIHPIFNPQSRRFHHTMASIKCELYLYTPSLALAVVAVIAFSGLTAIFCFRMIQTRTWSSIFFVLGAFGKLNSILLITNF